MERKDSCPACDHAHTATQSLAPLLSLRWLSRPLSPTPALPGRYNGEQLAQVQRQLG